MSAVYIGLDGLDGAFDDEFDSDSGGQMDDHIGIINKFGEQLAILNVIQVILHTAGRLEMTDVIDTARRKVVEQNDAVAAAEKPLREV